MQKSPEELKDDLFVHKQLEVKQYLMKANLVVDLSSLVVREDGTMRKYAVTVYGRYYY